MLGNLIRKGGENTNPQYFLNKIESKMADLLNSMQIK